MGFITFHRVAGGRDHRNEQDCRTRQAKDAGKHQGGTSSRTEALKQAERRWKRPCYTHAICRLIAVPMILSNIQPM